MFHVSMFQEKVILLNDFVVRYAVLVAPADAFHDVLPFYGFQFFRGSLVQN
jgi:hypothetical protein